MTVDVQKILDSIMPGIVSLLGAFLVFYLFKNKHVKPIMMMLYMLIVAAVCYFAGIM